MLAHLNLSVTRFKRKTPGIDIVRNKPHKNRFCGLSHRDTSKILGHKNKLQTTQEWYFTHTPGPPTREIFLNFGMQGNIDDVITQSNFMSIGSGVWGLWHPEICITP